MTSSDPERGDSGADKRQETCVSPSAEETDAQTTIPDDGQTVTQATTSSTDPTAAPTEDRKQNSDKPEPETASSGASFV